ncbi:lysozyme [Hyphococcus formosus]|uniref:lysozyme n=1 Tax=Hyphococcus formosus TaxID=3143534 RepID=UPI00398B5F98
MKTSESGIQLIKQFEGLELEAYQDIAGIWTIGYGHTGPDVQPGMKISEREAEELLRRDLKSREQAVESATKVPLNQNEFDALVSFVYNVGAGALRSSTALKRLNKGNRIGAADALTWWNKATVGGVLRPVLGLTRRRAAERALFLTPTQPVKVRDQKTLDDNTRITPIEDSPRRGNVAESRTVQGAAIAGGAGVASSTMGREDAQELHNLESNIEDGTGLTEVPNAMGDGSAPETGDDGTSEPETDDHDHFGDELEDGETTETIGIPSDERPSKHEVHAVEAQIQFALLILIVLAVLYVIYARVDDWFKFRR